ncbi:TetR/AcrR family transcriptional regulator [Undibacterium sp. TJN25]|uniref:TetR/AcrR family transcriptional regulator n=1 Tax=Undibacterium sp. TJN25 TaxID=3413056 RepID=UPI003BF3EE86
MIEKKLPPSSRREQNKAERRAAIVEIASRCFREIGYGGTTMSAIAQEMGGSKGTLWSYFSTKEELLAAVIDSATAAFHSFLATALDPEKDIRAVLTSFCETMFERISRPEAIGLQRLVISQAERFPEIGRLFYERAPAFNQAALTQFFSRHMEKGNIRPDDPSDASRMLLDMCTAGYHDRVLYGLEPQNKAIEQREAARVVKQFLRCYASEKV